MKCQSNFVRNLGSIGSCAMGWDLLWNIKVEIGIQLKKEIRIKNLHCRASFILKSLENIQICLKFESPRNNFGRFDNYFGYFSKTTQNNAGQEKMYWVAAAV